MIWNEIRTVVNPIYELDVEIEINANFEIMASRSYPEILSSFFRKLVFFENLEQTMSC